MKMKYDLFSKTHMENKYMISLICGLKNDTNKLIYKRERDSQISKSNLNLILIKFNLIKIKLDLPRGSVGGLWIN